MKTTKMRRVHVPHFCERCGKEEFEGRVFGRDRIRHLTARSGDRTMLCQECGPKEVILPKLQLSSFFTASVEAE